MLIGKKAIVSQLQKYARQIPAKMEDIVICRAGMGSILAAALCDMSGKTATLVSSIH